MDTYGEDFRYEDGVLYVRLSGEFPNELLQQKQNLFQPLIDACLSYKCTRALIDATDLDVDLGTMGLLQAGKDTVSLTDHKIRTAFLAREDMLDRFFEDVAAVHGAIIRVFTDIEAARDWLRG